MPVGELFLSAFLSVLFHRLASRELLQFASKEGLDSKLKKWERKLKMIEAVLSDAEEKQLTDKAVKMWLDDLRDLAYDVEDILDEFATEVFRRKLMAEDHSSPSKVGKLIPAVFTSWSPGAVKSNVSLGSKIKVISSRLEELCQQRTDFGLGKITGTTPTATSLRLPSTCVQKELAIHGREEDKAKILEMVLSDGPSNTNFSVVPIVGMAGIGKTTLARLVYNDKAVEDFNPRAWVCVSEDFDVLRISKAILESITFLPCDLKELNQVQVQLKKELIGKKFLLVLDDVWSKDYGLWETLRSPFMAGAPGSKIIATTRDKDIALTMRPLSDEYYNLKLLSDYYCWSLFMEHAFEGSDIGASQDLKSVREKVVKKCCGLPVAARTLGGLLGSKQRDEEWENILNSKIWDLPYENEIPAALKLSYYHLPSHLKRCFAYCAIFSKNYLFEQKELVLLWMAEGLIQESEGNRPMEEIGDEYFHTLLSMSFFQLSSYDSSKYVMHDLVNDLAVWASGETSFQLEDVLRGNKQLRTFENVRHFSYTSYVYDLKDKFEDLDKVEHLRTFLSIIRNVSPRFLTNTVDFNLLPKLKKLRVLSLRKYNITRLYDSIGGLKHLRYLNLSDTMIRSLPESTSLLFNLQVLILRNCSYLEKLPSNIQKLVNLRHLDISGAKLIREMPVGMKNLKCLRTLSDFILGRGIGSNLKDLKNLKLLAGEIFILGLENVIESLDRREFILSDKKGLQLLLLEWGLEFGDSRNELVEKDVLEILRPHKNLIELTIKGYGGTGFPSWVGDLSFSNIVTLRLEYCENCLLLPSLGQLGSLKDLNIKGMKGLKSIGSEIYGESCSKSFQSLETLCFEDLQEWECWEPIEENEEIERFPRLRKLSLVGCPKLFGRFPYHLPLLKKLVIRKCVHLMVSVSRLPMVYELEIDGCKEVVFNIPTNSELPNSITDLPNISRFRNWLWQRFPRIEFLGKLVVWQKEFCLEKPPQGLHSLSNLKKLQIEDCQSLVSFPEACSFPTLSELIIRNCNSLTFLPGRMKDNMASFEYLEIRGCDSLMFVIRGMPPSSLQNLYITDCKKLQCLSDDKEDFCTSSAYSSVIRKSNTYLPEYLTISKCPSLTCLSSSGQFLDYMTIRYIYVHKCENLVSLGKERLPSTTWSISLTDCELPNNMHNLKSLNRFFINGSPHVISLPKEGPPTNLKGLDIKDDKLFKSFLEWGPYKLTSLRFLTICGFPEIDAVTFPLELEMIFSTSLTTLMIQNFYKLEYLSSKAFQKLTSLKFMGIFDCPKLVSFPESGLPSSLERLYISYCPLIKKECKNDKGQEWSKIAHIPLIEIDHEVIQHRRH